MSLSVVEQAEEVTVALPPEEAEKVRVQEAPAPEQ
jgi:hypothetical protein